MTMRSSFVFYKSWHDAIKSFPADVQGEIYTVIMEYGLYGSEPHNMGKITSAIFALVRPQMDANQARYENGCKGAEFGRRGGRPKNPKKTPDENGDAYGHEYEKPSLCEVDEYCRERNNGIAAVEFFDFYESKGWMVGRNPMRDWRAAVRSWESKRKKEQGADNEPAQLNPVNYHA